MHIPFFFIVAMTTATSTAVRRLDEPAPGGTAGTICEGHRGRDAAMAEREGGEGRRRGRE